MEALVREVGHLTVLPREEYFSLEGLEGIGVL
jgi:hypothetical protein